MTRKTIATVLVHGAIAFLLFALLFANGLWRTSSSRLGSITGQVAAVFRDPATQWMAVLCLVFYFILFSILERRWLLQENLLRLDNANFWLSMSVGLVLLRYAWTYEMTAHSMQIPILMTGIVFGKAISFWMRWQPGKSEQRAVWLAVLLVILLVGAVLWHPKVTTPFQYHGELRWIGFWNSPNIYGLIMGVGLVLAVGIGIRDCQMTAGRRRKISITILCLIAAILTGYGLFKSYSRGAWLAVFAGLVYLAVQAVKSSRFSVSFRRNWLLLALLAASVLLLAFWQFRFSTSVPAQRVFSAANANDFSWRNRVTAWEGAARMMIDRPLAGFGWGQAEREFNKNYLSPRLTEGAAIEMNDYLMIGISAGAPALFCFAAYLALAFFRRSGGSSPPFSVFTTCRSGSIVLLIGFWFDGGLFKLPVAVLFWTLIELSRIESPVGDDVTRPTSEPGDRKSDVRNQSEPTCVASCSKKEIWLRWLAGILMVLAVAQTTVYLGTPFLPVSDGTLAIARKCLIRPNETADFEFLSANPVWRGQKLKALLEHVQLANYNRQLVNWKLDDKIYQDFVLSPLITGDSNEQLNWRRPLWEEFYPRIRHESSLENAAKIILKHLHERVTIAAAHNLPHDVPSIWLKKTTDEAGFEIIYIAALRSVGVPARLNNRGQAELFADRNWQAAPRPAL